MFLVVQGRFCNGFKFIGPFKTYDDGVRWLLLQDDDRGDIIVMTRSGCLAGAFVLVFGGVFDGFKVIGTFDSRDAVLGFGDWKNFPNARIAVLKCF